MFAQVVKVPGLVAQVGQNQVDASWYPCGDVVVAGWYFDGHRFTPSASAATQGPVVYTPWQIYQQQAQNLLGKSDITMMRIVEAVAQAKTTWAAADVQAWLTYRQALRAIVKSAFGDPTQPLPGTPAYPAGT